MNRLQYKVKRKKAEHANLLRNDSLELPAIKNVVMSFPVSSNTPRSLGVHSIHTPNKKIQLELEQILAKNNIRLNGSNVSKVIFGGPMKSKISLESTFRTSFGIHSISNRHGYHSFFSYSFAIPNQACRVMG